jgi:putative heme-binding domain-containing protein
VRHTKHRDIVDAALTSLGDRAGDVLSRLLANSPWLESADSSPVLMAIVGQIARQRHEADLIVLVEALRIPNSHEKSQGQLALIKALAQLPADALGGSNSPRIIELQQWRQSSAADLVRNARHFLVQNNRATLAERIAAIENLALDNFVNQQPLLKQLLSPQEPAAIHAAVLSTCSQYDAPAVADFVLERWTMFAPAERTQATELLLRREPWTIALLQYLSNEGVSLSTLNPAHSARLLNYPSAEARRLVRALRGRGIMQDRQQVFDDYREIALNGGDAAKGKLIFERNCASCHGLAGTGYPVGPNLASMINRGAASVLFNILAPNGEVDPRYLEYVVVTADGQVLTGMIAGETSTAVTLRAADNKLTTVLRVDIDELQNTGKSLMPEGFEKLIDKQSMADLLTYLQAAAAKNGASQ